MIDNRVEFNQLAKENGALNLGQGFPDYPAAPDHVIKGLSEATLSDDFLLHQYTRDFGHPRLVNVLSKLYSKLIDHPIDPMKEILVTIGAYEALYCTFMAHVNPGDEVIIIEPFYDCYEPMTRMAGGVPVFIPLRRRGDGTSSSDYVLDQQELESKFNSKTKMIVINTPNNPLGKIMTRNELTMIGDLCRRFDTIVLMDEVYEWIIYDQNQHVRMASLPGMWDRTITVGSVGKTFSVTGWKTGWAYGPQGLIHPMQMVHQNVVFACVTLIQEAVSKAFEVELDRMGTEGSYWKQLSRSLQLKRDMMAEFLRSANMKPIIPDGGYFMMADFNEVFDCNKMSSNDSQEPKDYQFAKWLVKNKKLQAIPPSAFYSAGHRYLGQDMIRFCFLKKDETLEKAGMILKQLD